MRYIRIRFNRTRFDKISFVKKSFSLVVCLMMLVSSLTMISFSKVAAASGSGTAYYVSTNGDDTNDGTSDTSPFRTVNFAGKKLQAGDTLFIMGGTYIQDQLTLITSGTVDEPITVKAYEGQTPIIDMENSTTYGGSGIFFNDYTDNIIIDGITVNNTRGTIRAIDLMTWPPVDKVFHTNITIKNCSINSCSYGIGMFGCQDITIINNHFEDCGGNLVYIDGVQNGEGAGDFIVLYYCQRVLVENNYFTRSGHYIMYTSTYYVDGKFLTSYDNIIRNNVMDQHWGGGIGIICGAHDTLVENNIITYCGIALLNYPKTGIQIAGDNNIIRNNLFAKAAANKGVAQNLPGDPGFTLQSYNFKDITIQSCENNRVYNNDIYKNGREGIRISQRDNVEVADNKVLNNIMYKNRAGGSELLGWLPGTLKTEPMWFNIQVEAMTTQGTAEWKTGTNGNLFYNNVFMPYANGGNAPGYNRFFWIGLKTSDVFYSVQGLNTKYPLSFFNNLEVDPMFVNEDDEDFSKTDFNLKEGSPCIDAGAHLAKTIEAGVAATQVKVDDSLFFCDGYGIVDGDMIKIGANNPVKIINVDHINNILTIDAPVTFTEGDYVDIPYQGNAPDMGMYESPYEATPTPVPTPTETPVPTATETPVPTPVATATEVPSPTPVVTAITFPDVNADNYGWAKESVEYLAQHHIINGSYVDGQLMYLPANTITRAELCKLIVAAYEFTQEGQATAFTDIDGHWAANYIAIASSLQIVKGYEDGTFKPDAGISRQELAVMIARAMAKKGVGIAVADNEIEQNLAAFLDQGMIDTWARKDVAFAVLNGIIKGNPVEGGFNFLPLDTANRAETAVMIKRAYDKIS